MFFYKSLHNNDCKKYSLLAIPTILFVFWLIIGISWNSSYGARYDENDYVKGGVVIVEVRDDLYAAAQYVSEGGIAQTIAEMAMRSGVGVRLEVPAGLDAFTFLWSESATRAVVVVPQDRNDEFLALCESKSFPVTKIGVVDALSKSVQLAQVFGETISLDIDELRTISEETLPRLFG